MVETAYPGTKSSIILTIVVVGILLLPFYIANNRERLRSGEGGYEFVEVMCWDLDSVDDFDNTFEDYTHTTHSTGMGALLLEYYHTQTAPRYRHSPIGISSVYSGLEGIVNGHGLGITETEPGYPLFYSPIRYDYMIIALNFNKNLIIDLDVVAIDIYIDVQDITFDTFASSSFLTWPSKTYIRSFAPLSIGDVTRIEISVDDLLAINALDEGEKFLIGFGSRVNGDHIPPNSQVVFDMQFYNIQEIKLSSIDFMGIAMAGGGLFMIFCSILMLPTIEFSGVIGWITGKRS